MQILYGADASNINLTAQKRLIRVVEGQTQATPYAGYLDPSLRETAGGIRVPKAGDTEGAAAGLGTVPISRLATSGTAFTYEGSLTPGLCLVKTTGENLAIHAGVGTPVKVRVKTFGLLGQWIGGTFDGIKSQNEISAWFGPDSVYDLLAPAWNDTGIAAEVLAAKAGKGVYLFAGSDGRLAGLTGLATQWHEKEAGTSVAEYETKISKEEGEFEKNGTAPSNPFNAVAEVVERPSSGVLRIRLLV